MSLVYTTEQVELAEAVRRFVAERAPLSVVREVAGREAPFDVPLWRALSDELGLTGVIVPAKYGGAGGSVADLTVALRELGAGLVPSPLVASGVLAATALLASVDEDLKFTWLPRIADGSVIGALAVSEPEVEPWVPARPRTVVTGDGSGLRVSGRKSAVLNGPEADILLVHAADGGEAGLYLVEASAPGVVVERAKSIDPTRSLATVTFEECLAVPVAGDAAEILGRVVDATNLALVAEQVGAIKACLAMTVEYAQDRFTFGQPIGAYQGVKHKLADLYTSSALADAALRTATEAADQDSAELVLAAASARALTSPAYVRAAMTTMLLHGGLGFTWEHDAHFFYKNAIAGNVLFGGAAYQLERVATSLSL
ncbi:acyl-CoA dehydrogenase family protein [Amycolatopsis sp. GM8]|uniref:acyl-CoA dehydrogenase family protein n=1 Tax=Amycolatopsis sp. GM8 TaxID=2896530 RepID=UPI001F2F041A|nr:acyl-CoA dehydrogenase family protein [Amycolatopsis sp. GM8]